MFAEMRSMTLTGWMKATDYVRAGGGWANEVLCYDSHDKVTLVNVRTHELLWKKHSPIKLIPNDTFLLNPAQFQQFHHLVCALLSTAYWQFTYTQHITHTYPVSTAYWQFTYTQHITRSLTHTDTSTQHLTHTQRTQTSHIHTQFSVYHWHPQGKKPTHCIKKPFLREKIALVGKNHLTTHISHTF